MQRSSQTTCHAPPTQEELRQSSCGPASRQSSTCCASLAARHIGASEAQASWKRTPRWVSSLVWIRSARPGVSTICRRTRFCRYAMWCLMSTTFHSNKCKQLRNRWHHVLSRLGSTKYLVKKYHAARNYKFSQFQRLWCQQCRVVKYHKSSHRQSFKHRWCQRRSQLCSSPFQLRCCRLHPSQPWWCSTKRANTKPSNKPGGNPCERTVSLLLMSGLAPV